VRYTNIFSVIRNASDVGGCSFCSNRGEVVVIRSHHSTLEVRACVDRCARELHTQINPPNLTVDLQVRYHAVARHKPHL
jgi:hypothetical protein